MARKKATWTVMVYLAGDNNLTSECMFALTEMKKALPGKQINVIAQFDPRDEYLPTHRYEINRKGSDSTLFDDIIDEAHYNPATGEVEFKNESARARSLAARRAKRSVEVKRLFADVEDLSTLSFIETDTRDDTDTGSPSTLYNFLSFCIQEYPADHYLVVLSGHAGGVETDYLLKDESSKGSLTFNEMKQVFRELRQDLEGKSLDIVGMDNCLMSMSEICYELRDVVDIVVGCESFSPASGWPYRQIVERLRKEFVGNKTSKRKSFKVKAAKAIVEEYVNYYSPYWMSGMSVSQSALDLRRAEELRLHVDSLAAVMEQELKKEEFEANRLGKRRSRGRSFKDNLVLAHWETQSYNGERFVDLVDFCVCLEERKPPAAVARSCKEMRRFISEEFVLKSCYSGAAYQYSYGVSIYFPWAQVLAKYQNLEFVRESNGAGWLSFLRTYTQLTRRKPRGFVENVSARMNGAGSTGASMRMADDRMADDRMADDRMADDRMADDRMADDRMADDRMADDRMADDRMADDRMVEDRMANDRMMASEGIRISSMRNPPVVFLPTKCIRERDKSGKVVKRFFRAGP
jgi:hypothetical protein